MAEAREERAPLTVLLEFVEDTLDDLDPESECVVTVTEQRERVLIVVKPAGPAARIIGGRGANINAVRHLAGSIGARLLHKAVSIDIDAPRPEPGQERPRYVDPRRRPELTRP